jgi:hypothetical protein
VASRRGGAAFPQGVSVDTGRLLASMGENSPRCTGPMATSSALFCLPSDEPAPADSTEPAISETGRGLNFAEGRVNFAEFPTDALNG